MTELTYFEAWALWLQGEVVADRALWGLPILGWGRIGKIVGLIAGLTVVAEIIGPQRLRKFGTALRRGALAKSFRVPPVIKVLRATVSHDRDLSDDERWTGAYGLARISGSVLGGLATLIVLWPKVGAWAFLAFLPATLIFFFEVVVNFILSSTVIVIRRLLLYPIARVLERESIGDIIKLVSVALLLAGFHFDLLAS